MENKMSAELYFEKIEKQIHALGINSMPAIKQAAEAMANSIAAGRVVYYFGSGHSCIPALDVFPRYGSFVGLQPLHNTPLMWQNVVGPGGTPELLWIERQEGYVANVLKYYVIKPEDTFIVISHGGLNAASIECAMIAKEHGATVVALTSMENYKLNPAKHSSGKKLADVADIVIDNGAPPEDSIIHIDGWDEPVAASSTVTCLTISMSLVAQTAANLAARGIHIPTFVSPNVAKTPDHNDQVYKLYCEKVRRAIY